MTDQTMLEFIDLDKENDTGWAIGDHVKYHVRDFADVDAVVTSIDFYKSEDRWIVTLQDPDGTVHKEILAYLLKE